MPARPLAGPSDQSTPHGRKLPVVQGAACVRGASIDRPPRERRHRRTPVTTASPHQIVFPSVSPRLRVDARSVISVPSVRRRAQEHVRRRPDLPVYEQIPLLILRIFRALPAGIIFASNTQPLYCVFAPEEVIDAPTADSNRVGRALELRGCTRFQPGCSGLHRLLRHRRRGSGSGR